MVREPSDSCFSEMPGNNRQAIPSYRALDIQYFASRQTPASQRCLGIRDKSHHPTGHLFIWYPIIRINKSCQVPSFCLFSRCNDNSMSQSTWSLIPSTLQVRSRIARLKVLLEWAFSPFVGCFTLAIFSIIVIFCINDMNCDDYKWFLLRAKRRTDLMSFAACVKFGSVEQAQNRNILSARYDFQNTRRVGYV